MNIVLKRFLKAFLSGGAGALSVALVAAPSLTTLASLKMWLSTLAVAFISGGLLAIEKALQTEPQ